MKPLEKELDKLIQLWAVNHCSQLSKQKAQCGQNSLYCDVIIERWQNFTGQKAIRVDGKNHDEIQLWQMSKI